MTGPRFTKRVRRGLSAIAASADAGCIIEDIFGIQLDSEEAQTQEWKRRVEDVELALRWMWAHSLPTEGEGS